MRTEKEYKVIIRSDTYTFHITRPESEPWHLTVYRNGEVVLEDKGHTLEEIEKHLETIRENHMKKQFHLSHEGQKELHSVDATKQFFQAGKNNILKGDQWLAFKELLDS